MPCSYVISVCLAHLSLKHEAYFTVFTYVTLEDKSHPRFEEAYRALDSVTMLMKLVNLEYMEQVEGLFLSPVEPKNP